mmetsp:Transcript_122707/g.192609  ORF Transcript_122707/g.192609 Transcript_122707/m.192609 type:complete len:659 (+) Transcript_122707:12-1988(+)
MYSAEVVVPSFRSRSPPHEVQALLADSQSWRETSAGDPEGMVASGDRVEYSSLVHPEQSPKVAISEAVAQRAWVGAAVQFIAFVIGFWYFGPKAMVTAHGGLLLTPLIPWVLLFILCQGPWLAVPAFKGREMGQLPIMFLATFMLVVFWMIIGGATISHCLIHSRNIDLDPPIPIPNRTGLQDEDFQHGQTAAVVCFSDSALLKQMNNVVEEMYEGSLRSFMHNRPYPAWGISFTNFWPIMQCLMGLAFYRMYWHNQWASYKMPSSMTLLLDLVDCIVLFEAVFDQNPYFWFESGIWKAWLFLTVVGIFWSLTIGNLAYEFTDVAERMVRVNVGRADEEMHLKTRTRDSHTKDFEQGDTVKYIGISSGGHCPTQDEEGTILRKMFDQMGNVSYKIEVKGGNVFSEYDIPARDLELVEEHEKPHKLATLRTVLLNLFFLGLRLVLRAKTEYVTSTMMTKNIVMLLAQNSWMERLMQEQIRNLMSSAADANYRKMEAAKNKAEAELLRIKKRDATADAERDFTASKMEGMVRLVSEMGKDSQDVANTLTKIGDEYIKWRKDFDSRKYELRGVMKEDNRGKFDDFCSDLIKDVSEFAEKEPRKIKDDNKDVAALVNVSIELQKMEKPAGFKGGRLDIFKETALLSKLTPKDQKTVKDKLMR